MTHVIFLQLFRVNEGGVQRLCCSWTMHPATKLMCGRSVWGLRRIDTQTLFFLAFFLLPRNICAPHICAGDHLCTPPWASQVVIKRIGAMVENFEENLAKLRLELKLCMRHARWVLK